MATPLPACSAGSSSFSHVKKVSGDMTSFSLNTLKAWLRNSKNVEGFRIQNMKVTKFNFQSYVEGVRVYAQFSEGRKQLEALALDRTL